jgi:hypothetical protein
MRRRRSAPDGAGASPVLVDEALDDKRAIAAKGKPKNRKAQKRPPGPGTGPGMRGLPGRGGGAAHHIEPAPEWRGTTVQTCGLWPFVVGTGTPMVGVPLGHHYYTNETVCCDPMSWFAYTNLLNNPSAILFALPGRGKSTVARRMCVGLAGFGTTPMCFGDLKGEHSPVMIALGGSVVSLGRGEGTLNIIDPGAGAAAARRLVGEAKRRLLADTQGRRLTTLAGLIALNRQGRVSDHEETILATAMRVLDEKFRPGYATLHDLVKVLDEGNDELRLVTLTRGKDYRYREAVDPLQRSVVALTRGALGESFAGRTTVAMDLSRPLCVDISGIGENDLKLGAAALLACWGEGFAAIAAAQALADAGLEPQRHFLVVCDEMWRVLRAGGSGMVDRIDALTRLDRHLGTSTLLITHTPQDLLSVPDPVDAIKARGFVARVGMKIVGGLPDSDVDDLEEVIKFSQKERKLITEWSSPPSWDRKKQMQGAPPGQGKFLIKVGGRPGIPIRVKLTDGELGLNNTNTRWTER